MLDPYNKVLFALAEHARVSANSDRVGYVHEIQKDKMRICMGIRPDGSPWLSPWLHTTDHRGGTRERDVYKAGQNVRMSSPGGDHRQATVSPWAESDSFPAPAHADQYLDDKKQPYAHTGQIGKLRWAKVGPKDNSGSGGGGSGGGGSGGGLMGDSSGGSGDGVAYDIWIADEDDSPP